MKKFIALIFAFICCFPLTACDNNNGNKDNIKNFVADGSHCVVSILEEYDISINIENSELSDLTMINEDLQNAEKVNGKPKKEGFKYYYVPNNAAFRICTPNIEKLSAKENSKILVYWKLNDTLYKEIDNEGNYSKNVFSCWQYTEITPVYYDYREVGVLVYQVDENLETVAQDSFFDNNGKIKEQEGVYYLYGVYDFEPEQKFWRTNLTLNKYSYKHCIEENYKEYYQLDIDIATENLFEYGTVVIQTLCKIEGLGYMTGDTMIYDTGLGMIHTVQLGKHKLRCQFV